jgi:hypothetical protein
MRRSSRAEIHARPAKTLRRTACAVHNPTVSAVRIDRGEAARLGRILLEVAAFESARAQRPEPADVAWTS